MENKPSSTFLSLVKNIPETGKAYHQEVLLAHARSNQPFVVKSLSDLPKQNSAKYTSCIIISAGPSSRRQKSIQRIAASSYQGTIISVDGSYVACLEAGLIPDYVITMDPHPKRVVRWFGDPDIEKNSINDDYFKRQDLDVEFRKNTLQKNQENILFVNRHAHLTKAIVCTSLHTNTVVTRLREATFDLYWWNPLVDDPQHQNSLTRKLYEINAVPCLNTGGTVGTAAWVFAHDILKIPFLALVGMDYGYYADTPIEKTQTYYELLNHAGGRDNLEKYFVSSTFPLTNEKFYTDSTYFWYKQNFLELMENATAKTVNCTEGGTLIEEQIPIVPLERFLQDFSAPARG